MVRFPFKFPAVGAKELRANILYPGLCHSDVLTVREQWGPTTFPIAPGHEIIAEVSQVGSEVKNFKKGDLVGFGTMRDCCGKCENCKEGKEEICTTEGEHFTYGKYWDMHQQFNNLLISFSIYQRNSTLLKELLFSVLVSLLTSQCRNS